MTATIRQPNRFRKFFAMLCFALIVAAHPGLGLCAPAKVAILPIKVSAKENPEFLKKILTDMILTKLGRDPGAVTLVDLNDAKEDASKEAAIRHGAGYVISTELTVSGAELKLDAEIYSAPGDKTIDFSSSATGLDSIIALSDRLTEAVFAEIRKDMDASGASAIITRPNDAPVAWKSQPMDGTFLAMKYVDLNNDGVKELVLLSKRNLVIAAVGPNGLETISEFKANLNTIYAAVTAADTDADGKTELYVSGLVNGLTSGMRIEFSEGGYKVTGRDIKWMMRTFRFADRTNSGAPHAKTVLAGQKFRLVSGFFGKLVFLKKSGEETVEAGAFIEDLPRGADIYNMLLPNDESLNEIFVIDQRGYFMSFNRNEGDDWERLFKSSDYYGGTLNLLEDTETSPGMDARDPVPIANRYYFTDLNRDNKNEVVLSKNISSWLGRLSKFPKSFGEGEIIGLSWDKFVQNYVEQWKTKPMSGYVADFFIDAEPDGTKLLYILIVSPDEKSYVLSRKM